ncbi:P-loop containing nucleoside triphosphate hydrolase protein [Podospora conica]|nr:P-loop containing nucleoside triphosphate hydrolase protein [Schizothecium conicum]
MPLVIKNAEGEVVDFSQLGFKPAKLLKSPKWNKAVRTAALGAEQAKLQIQGQSEPPSDEKTGKDQEDDKGKRPLSWSEVAAGKAKTNKTTPNPTKATTTTSKDSEPSADDKDLENRGFDVFATPYVPANVKSINQLPGFVISTHPTKQVDYSRYVEDHLISRFLPTPPAPCNIPYGFILEDGLRLAVLSPLSYERFFDTHIQSEMQHQQLENDSLALYSAKATVEFTPDGEGAIVTLVVPGLRENSPYIEEDDRVQLRQLRVAEPNNTLLTHVWDQTSMQYLPVTPWTTYIYEARVLAVIRTHEQLVLSVHGLRIDTSEVNLSAPGNGMMHRLSFNVQFPFPEERLLPQLHVLALIQESLGEAAEMTKRAAGIDLTLNTDHWHPSNQFWVQSMLFPTEADCNVQANAHSGIFPDNLFDKQLNLEQRIAMENICQQNYGVMPYLISGPPGTGKTKTIIETALQLIANIDAVSHILICAPSEQAADTLVERLAVHLKPAQMLRLTRPVRSFGEVPQKVLPYCHVSPSTNTFGLPPFETIMAYSIVVSTCRDAAMLISARLTNRDLHAVSFRLLHAIHPTAPPPPTTTLHWSALLIDEAAQATEPTALLPLAVVAPPSVSSALTFTPLVVMAGDEHQLNPRTSSPASPLRRSLFARLFSLPVYAHHPLARHAPTHRRYPALRPSFTPLRQNYRSHPAILAVPSALFYNDTLLAAAPADKTHALVGWEGWPSRHRPNRWPVLYHDNRSDDGLECDGGGWTNRGEAEVVAGYVRRLVEEAGVEQREIAVMSPFSAQVKVLRSVLRGMKTATGSGMWDVNVGPTEAFQGLEFKVVVLCVTRSRARFVGRDRELGWGVVGMRQRMNVALTRAQAGLVVVGSREVMCGEEGGDEWWREWVGFCERNGLVAGGEGRGGKEARGAAVGWMEDMLVEMDRAARAKM